MMDDIYEITQEEEEDIKFQEKCEAQKNEVPIVRCKDCQKCEYDGEYGHYWCTEPFGTVGCIGVLGTFYCGFGVKRIE